MFSKKYNAITAVTKELNARDYREFKKNASLELAFSQTKALFMFRFVETKVTNDQNNKPNWTDHQGFHGIGFE